MTQQFNASAKPTLGVEWELALIDPQSRDLVPRAADLINATTTDIQLEREFLQNTVELVTGVCYNTPEAIAQLRQGVHDLQTAAASLGVKLWSSGSHPFSDFRENPVSEKGHYTEIIERTRYWGNQMLIWGVHCHVGVSHQDRVWPIINALMTKYPHLLAPSASSPGWDGLDTGYASNRTMLYQQLPTAGMPPQLRSWQEWESYMVDQSRSGVINHTGSMHLDIRPAGKWGTIEVRVSDAPSNLHELSAVVALTHCLVIYYDRLLSEEGPAALPSLQPWHLTENKWRAARYGLDALIITDRATNEAWVKDELYSLVELLEPTAKEFGCTQELHQVEEILVQGAAYQRQREMLQETGSWLPVVDMTCAELLASM
ncbi:glutamate--cysteine ligase [Corynebacterium poyangense]|uniref:Putative glutamate--cysteine ligase 2 n=1 Tax=Corynebacterium poyangense TaxID=2684405 RepID=A0A7H0SRA9_9CORY|nr:glutamate--cysteine ligase [Corynebacterium poyangense]QNQ91084.1 glutamate--cysteine ligase [Corynebacterium poyangense]